MKICAINNLYKPHKRGGAEIVFENIIEELKKRGHEVFVITSKSITKPTNEKEDKKNKIYRLRSCNIVSYNNLAKIPKTIRLFWHLVDMFDVVNYWRVKSIVKKEKCDLVMTHNLKGMGYLIPRAIKKIGVKHIHTLHDIQLIHPSGLMIFGQEKIINNFFAKIYSFLCSFLFRSPEIIISPSKWLLDLHERKKFFIKSKKIILPNPIKISNIESKNKNTNSDVSCFIYVGLIEKHKGIDMLLKSFQNLRYESQYKKCRLNVIGDGSLLEKYKKIYKKENNIFFLGRLKNNEVLEELKKSNGLIVPSLCYENSPTVIYESASTKTPIIATRIGGITELIHDLGGLLFEPKNEKDLIRQMKWLINNYDDYVKKQACGKKIIKYDINKYVDKLLKS